MLEALNNICAKDRTVPQDMDVSVRNKFDITTTRLPVEVDSTRYLHAS